MVKMMKKFVIKVFILVKKSCLFLISSNKLTQRSFLRFHLQIMNDKDTPIILQLYTAEITQFTSILLHQNEEIHRNYKHFTSARLYSYTQRSSHHYHIIKNLVSRRRTAHRGARSLLSSLNERYQAQYERLQGGFLIFAPLALPGAKIALAPL